MEEYSSPGYIESKASSKRKSKENLKVEQLIPSEILDASGDTGIKQLLKKYYEFMNMDEFIYVTTESYTDIILDGLARFRIPDPDGTDTSFFTDENGVNSTLVVTNNDGSTTNISLSNTNIAISNGNELPGSLAKSTSEIGKTFTVSGLSSHNTKSAKLTTEIKHWVGPGPSYVLNAIEDAMDIDKNSGDSNDPTHKYLELMQKEIAAIIPRDLEADKSVLYKQIIDFYKIRGSSDSIETFFRIFFQDEVQVQKPYDNTLIPSSGDWSTDTNQFISTKGFISEKKNRIHDSYRYQKYSYLIKTGKNFTDWEYTFNRLVHPAGFIFFGEILILLNLVRDTFGDNSKGITVSTKNLATGGLVDQVVNVYGRTNRETLSSMPGIQPGVIGLEDIPLLVEMFASIFTPTPAAKIYKTAILSPVITSGAISDIEIVNKGYGYSSAPTLTISGNGSNAVATATINANGEVEDITVSQGGSGYTEAAVTANAPSGGVGKIADIDFPGLANKTYRKAPNIVIGQPTAVDTEGELLSTNIQATAKFNLEPVGLEIIRVTNGGSGYTSEPTVTISGNATARATINPDGEVDGIRILTAGSGYTEQPTITISGGNGNGATAEAFLLPAEITTINITNRGNGYVLDPNVTLGSSAVSERRAKNLQPIAIVLLNYLQQVNNNYFSLKGDSYYNSDKKFALNQSIEQFGDQIIQNNYKNSINSYNVSSYINIG